MSQVIWGRVVMVLRYEESLRNIVQDIENEYLLSGNGKTFQEFYRGWKEKRLFRKKPSSVIVELGGVECYSCHRHVDGDQLIVNQTTTPDSVFTCYFHPECFVALV